MNGEVRMNIWRCKDVVPNIFILIIENIIFWIIDVNNYAAEVTECLSGRVNLICHLPKYDTHAWMQGR